MSTATLTPYKNNTTQVTFSLVSETSNGATYLVGGRALSLPYSLAITRKLTAQNSTANDEINIVARRVESNATTSKLSTAYVKLIVSIPKDTTVINAAAQKELISVLASLLNDSTAMGTGTVAMTALIEGRNL